MSHLMHEMWEHHFVHNIVLSLRFRLFNPVHGLDFFESDVYSHDFEHDVV